MKMLRLYRPRVILLGRQRTPQLDLSIPRRISHRPTVLWRTIMEQYLLLHRITTQQKGRRLIVRRHRRRRALNRFSR